MSPVFVAGCAWVSILMATPAFAQDGAALYAQRCASCHEGSQPRVPTRDVIAALTPDRIVGALETGTIEAGVTCAARSTPSISPRLPGWWSSAPAS